MTILIKLKNGKKSESNQNVSEMTCKQINKKSFAIESI